MTTLYANGDAQAALSEQVTQTKRKTTPAAPRASSKAGTIARMAVIPGEGEPIRRESRAMLREQALGESTLSSATSKTSSGVGVGIAPIAPSVIVEAHRTTQSPVGSSSTVGDTLNIHSINLNGTERYPGWVCVAIWLALGFASWAALVTAAGYAVSVILAAWPA